MFIAPNICIEHLSWCEQTFTSVFDIGIGFQGEGLWLLLIKHKKFAFSLNLLQKKKVFK